MPITPGSILYPSPGVLTHQDGQETPTAVAYAYKADPTTLVAHAADGSEDSYTFDANALQSYNAGVVKFTDNSGTAYQIRPLDDSDGEWLSRYHTPVPAEALAAEISGHNNAEGSPMSEFLKDQRETMVAFQFPDDDYLFGLLYINKFGAYILTDGRWVMVPQNDDTFDDTYPFYVNPATVDDFLAAWSKGPVNVEEAKSSQWVLEPDADTGEADPQDEQISEREADADGIPTEAAPETDTTEKDEDA